jgi:hypothetical protein
MRRQAGWKKPDRWWGWLEITTPELRIPGVNPISPEFARRDSRNFDKRRIWEDAGLNVHLKRSASTAHVVDDGERSVGAAVGYGVGVNLAIRVMRPGAPICSAAQANASVAPRQRSASTSVKSGASVRSVANFLKSSASSR